MTEGLRISKTLTLPLDAVTQKFGDMGRTGSGKTYGATKRAEEMLDAGAQIIALDPVGVWYGLRIGADGNAGYSIPVFGGLHGDVPLASTAGPIIADLIVDRGISCVLDVSQFETNTEKARFAMQFADRFFFRKKAAPSAVHLFLEECQEFVPQNAQPGEQHMLGVFERLIKLGRNFGIGVSLISQRPQEVNKKALEQVECLLAYQMTGTRSRKAIEEWASSHDLNEDLGEILPTLPIGEPFIYSPQWLRISKRIRIAKKKTADVSATPTVGAAVRIERSLAPVDLEQLQMAIAASVDQAKADDPKELRKRIRELEEQVARTPSAHDIAQDGDLDYERGRREGYDEAFELGRQSGADDTRLEERHTFSGVIERILEAVLAVDNAFDQHVAPALEQARGLLHERVEEYRLLPDPAPHVPLAPTRPPTPTPRATPAPLAAPRVRATNNGNGSTAVTGPMHRVLQSVRQLEALGTPKPTVIQVALFTGVSHTTGSYQQNVRELVGDGYLIRETGRVSLTQSGRTAAGDVSIPSRAGILDFWTNKLSGPQAAQLREIVRHRTIRREALAEILNVSATTGSFQQNLRDMRTYGLIDFKQGTIMLTDLLFPKGLR